MNRRLTISLAVFAIVTGFGAVVATAVGATEAPYCPPSMVTDLVVDGPANPQPGDTVTATWSADCPTGAVVTLVVADNPAGTSWDPNVDQALLDAVTVPATVGRVSITVPPWGPSCASQVDLVTGPALQVVGPSGGYYSHLQAEPRLLWAAYTSGDCTRPSTTVPEPSPAPPVEPLEPPSTVVDEPGPPPSISTYATTPPPVAIDEPVVAYEAPAARLPETGRPTRTLVLLAANLAGIGAVLWVWACRLRKVRS